jgi:hypothetical protein
VPCTTCPANHPAMRPTASMTVRLSLDMTTSQYSRWRELPDSNESKTQAATMQASESLQALLIGPQESLGSG